MGLLKIEEGFTYLLANDPGVSGHVGDRISPPPLPQVPTLPALTYQLITPMSIVAHDGMCGTAMCRYQITGFHTDYAVLVDLMEHVRICMTGYKGTITSGANSIVVQAMLPAGGGPDFYDPVIKRYMRLLDFWIWYNEPIT